MANLIDYSYFTGDVNIPNSNDQNIQSRLSIFISTYEVDFLNKILGYELYKRVVDSPSNADIILLMNGTEYEDDNGVTQKWKGLIDTSAKRSIIANYIYKFWMVDSTVQYSGNSVYVPISTDKEVSNPHSKVHDVWRYMSSEVYSMVCYLLSNENKSKYPEYNSTIASRALYYVKPLNYFDI